MKSMSTLRRSRRRLATTGVVLVAGVSFAFAGCGSSGRTAAGAGDVAAFIPAGSPIYVEMSTDLDAPQWTQALTLAQRFPGYPKLIAEAAKELSTEGIDFNSEIKPLLGDTAAVGLYDLKGFDIAGASSAKNADDVDAKFVIAVDLADGKDQEFIALLQKGDDAPPKVGSYKGSDIYGDDEAAIATVDGKVIVAQTKDEITRVIDAHAAGGDRTMAGSERLAEAFAQLPDEVVAQAFVDFATLVKTGDNETAKQLANAGIGPDAAVAFSASAEADGVRVKGVQLGFTDAAGKAEEFTPKLVSRVPADALAYVGLQNAYALGAQGLAQASGDPEIKEGLSQAKLGLSLLGIGLDDIKALTSKEHAFVVTKGAPTPGVVAALEVDDPAAVTKTLDKLRETVPALASTAGRKLPPFRKVELGNGVTGWESPLSPEAGAVYGVDGNLAYIGTKPDAIRRVQNPGATLADDPEFQAATRQMPAKVTMLAWVNGVELLTTLDGLGVLKDAPKDTIANVRPLKSLAMWATGGDRPTFEAFLTIK